VLVPAFLADRFSATSKNGLQIVDSQKARECPVVALPAQVFPTEVRGHSLCVSMSPLEGRV